MTTTVSGVLKDGMLELLERTVGLREGRVRVTIEEEPEAKLEPRYIQFGKYKGGHETTLEDFKEAEWHGEPEFEEFRE